MHGQESRLVSLSLLSHVSQSSILYMFENLLLNNMPNLIPPSMETTELTKKQEEEANSAEEEEEAKSAEEEEDEEEEAKQRPIAIGEGAETKPLISLPPLQPPPPPSSSSPTHDFSFAISLHPPLPTPAPTGRLNRFDKSPASLAIDLAPADDIFFHGHLLPLQLLSHPTTISTCTSRLSVENSTLPSRDPKNCNTAAATNSGGSEGKDRRKTTKTFSSLFSGIGRWRKGLEAGETVEEEEDKGKKKEKKSSNRGFDFLRFLRKYASVVDVRFLFFRGAAVKGQREKRPYSFSGSSNLTVKAKRRAEFSAPASMRTSPTNSGYLLAPGTNFSSSDESTMEELQSAIQAAIQHCKNSISIKQEEPCPC